jgi:Flp pilus assembly protein TadG
MRGQWERGSTIVETALVLGIFLFLVFGVIDFGRALYTYHLVGNAARLGTRFAIVRGSMCAHSNAATDPWPCPNWANATTPNPGGPNPTTEIQNYVEQQSIVMGLGNVTVTPTWSYYNGCNNGAPDANNINNEPGCLVTVTVSYTFQFWTPFLPSGNYNMSSTSQMVISQ